MDRYIIIDTQEMSIITANNITFNDETDGGSEMYADKQDFIRGVSEIPQMIK